MQTLICTVPEETVIDLSSGTCPGTWQLINNDPYFSLMLVASAFIVVLLGIIAGRLW